MPEPLADRHGIEDFRCSEAELAHWLKQRARHNQREGASRTFIVREGLRVVGYCCLAAGADVPIEETGSRQRKPDMQLYRMARMLAQ